MNSPGDTAPTPIVVESNFTLDLPSRWSGNDHDDRISVSSDGRDLFIIGENAQSMQLPRPVAVRSDIAISPTCGIYYYEVEILNAGQKGDIGIGFSGPEFDLSRHVGWHVNSWGYHGDDGNSFNLHGLGSPYGPTFWTGDIVGCGVDFSQKTAFYTKNGEFIGLVFNGVGKDCQIHASVSFGHSEQAVRTNFGQETFYYNLDRLAKDRTKSPLYLPTRWSRYQLDDRLSVSSDGRDLSVVANGHVALDEPAAVRSDLAIPPACGIYYYEVEILNGGQTGTIGIGFSAADVSLNRHPGWEQNSWAYHGDDGKSFDSYSWGSAYGPTYWTGDTIGCGVDFSQNRAFYTKNGVFLGWVFNNVGEACTIYASVGLCHGDHAVRANFGQEQFQYNLDGLPQNNIKPRLDLPDRWSRHGHSNLLSVSPDGRELSVSADNHLSLDEPAAARSDLVIPSECSVYYYEVKILDDGQTGEIGVGFAVSTVKLDRHPGWDQHSWGYHGDSGNSFDCSVEAPYGPTFSTGDVIGCGVDFSSNEAFFTKNGDLIGRVFRNVGKDCQIHAFIGLRHGGQVVRANFGRDPFRYNIAGLNKATETSDLNETDIDILAFIPPESGGLPPLTRSKPPPKITTPPALEHEKVSGAMDRTADVKVTRRDPDASAGCTCVIQ